MDHLEKAITLREVALREVEGRNTHLDHAEVHRRLKTKQTATK